MAFKNIVLFAICMISLFSCTDKKTIELSLIAKKGYGPFAPNLNQAMIISPKNGIEDLYSNISGFPTDWTDVKHGIFETNGLQATYQKYAQGDMSKKEYENIQESSMYIPDTLSLSKKPIRTKIAFVCGKDSTNEFKMIVDANNNLNFSDDVIFTPIIIDDNQPGNLDSLAQFNSLDVAYERFINNKIEKITSPILIVYNNRTERIYYNFSQYMVARLEGEEIAVRSDFFRDFAFQYPWLVLIDEELKTGNKVADEKIILKNGYIEIKEKFYKVLGISNIRNALILERTKLKKNLLTSNQVGFKTYPVNGSDFKTKTPISLDSMRGKYVLLDFWSVYCGPCLYELPNLKALYDKVDKSKFEIIGLALLSPDQQLTNVINEHSINWPIILLDNNDLLSQFSIFQIPTTYLIDKEGIIIEKDLRWKELEDRVLSLVNE